MLNIYMGTYLLSGWVIVMKTLILSFLIAEKICSKEEFLHLTCSFSEQRLWKNTEVDLEVSFMSYETLELASTF